MGVERATSDVIVTVQVLEKAGRQFHQTDIERRNGPETRQSMILFQWDHSYIYTKLLNRKGEEPGNPHTIQVCGRFVRT